MAIYWLLFYTIKIVDWSEIWAQIVRLEGKRSDHLTTTTTQLSAS